MEHPHLPDYASLLLDWEKFRQLQEQIPYRPNMIYRTALSSEFSKAHGLVSVMFHVRMNQQYRKNLLGGSRRIAFTNTFVVAEMSPDINNRVTLSNSRRDRLGQPIAHVALRFDPQEILTVHKHLNAQLIRSGLGRMGNPRRAVAEVGGGHMMGTTRMGSDPKLSVTDARGRVHGVKNLYIAGSSLFPAAEAAHPTLTIVALSLRLAAHLAEREAA